MRNRSELFDYDKEIARLTAERDAAYRAIANIANANGVIIESNSLFSTDGSNDGWTFLGYIEDNTVLIIDAALSMPWTPSWHAEGQAE